MLRHSLILSHTLTLSHALAAATLAPNGTFFLQLTGSGCEGTPARGATPHASVLRPHYYFGNRLLSSLDKYAYFDSRTWSAFLGQGSDATQWVIAGGSADGLAKLNASPAS